MSGFIARAPPLWSWLFFCVQEQWSDKRQVREGNSAEVILAEQQGYKVLIDWT